MDLLEEAGLPPGVINMVTGHGKDASDVVFDRPRPGGRPLHRLHAGLPVVLAADRREPHLVPVLPAPGRARPAARTSSSPTRRRTSTCSAPRWCAAPSSTRARSARPPRGPTCRAACGAELRDAARRRGRRAHDGRRHRPVQLHGRGHRRPCLRQARRPAEACGVRLRPSRSWPGGTADDSDGWFVRPTVLVGSDPTHDIFRTEYFGPHPRGPRLRRRRLRRDARPDGGHRRLRTDRFDRSPATGRSWPRSPTGSASPPATSTSTTSRRVRWSVSSRSAVRGPVAPTTRPAAR